MLIIDTTVRQGSKNQYISQDAFTAALSNKFNSGA